MFGLDLHIDWASVIALVLGRGLRIVLIIVLAYILYSILKKVMPGLVNTVVTKGEGEGAEEELAKRSATLSHFALRTAFFAIFAIALFMVLSDLGIDIAPVLAGAGIAGLAIGFGAQTLVRDIISGFFILMEDQYRVGDVVRVADVAGLVERVGLRRTILRDLDGIVHSIPNGQIGVASNFTRGWSRVNMNVSVAYKEDLDKVIEVINRVGKELSEDEKFGPMILEPPHVLRVDEFQDSGIAIKIVGNTKPIKQWEVTGEMRRRLKKAFDEEGIEIPFPHRVVFTRVEGKQ